MTGRLSTRIEKVEKGARVGSLHLIACCDDAEAAAAKCYLGDRFGDLIFVITGVREGSAGCTGTERRGEWLFQAKHNPCVKPWFAQPRQ